MSAVIMYGSAIIAVAVVIFMLIKKMDIKITLFLMGVALMFIAMVMGNGISADFAGTGAPWLDPLKAIADQFKSKFHQKNFQNAGERNAFPRFGERQQEFGRKHLRVKARDSQVSARNPQGEKDRRIPQQPLK